MGNTHSTRRSAGSSLSSQSTETPAPEGDKFDDLFRRLLVAVCHVRLVSQHFGDLSSLSQEDAPAGLTLYEAARDLDALYDDLESWHVRTEHTPKVPAAGDAAHGTHESGAHRFFDHQSGLPIAGLAEPLACPFCGRNDVSIALQGRQELTSAHAECGFCGVEGGHANLADDAEDNESSRFEMIRRVVQFWNTRAQGVRSPEANTAQEANS